VGLAELTQAETGWWSRRGRRRSIMYDDHLIQVVRIVQPRDGLQASRQRGLPGIAGDHDRERQHVRDTHA